MVVRQQSPEVEAEGPEPLEAPQLEASRRGCLLLRAHRPTRSLQTTAHWPQRLQGALVEVVLHIVSIARLSHEQASTYIQLVQVEGQACRQGLAEQQKQRQELKACQCRAQGRAKFVGSYQLEDCEE